MSPRVAVLLALALVACAPVTPKECVEGYADTVLVGYHDGKDDQAACTWAPSPPTDPVEGYCYALGYDEGWAVSMEVVGACGACGG